MHCGNLTLHNCGRDLGRYRSEKSRKMLTGSPDTGEWVGGSRSWVHPAAVEAYGRLFVAAASVNSQEKPLS